jgi:hypothetical protein
MPFAHDDWKLVNHGIQRAVFPWRRAQNKRRRFGKLAIESEAIEMVVAS